MNSPTSSNNRNNRVWNFLKKIFPLIFFIFLAFGILYPNPFGNNPDIIGDESYFLSSALLAIQQFSLPGWVWSTSTTYYGGPETYVDTAIMVPIVGGVVVASHFSLTTAKFWIATHTGDLLHVLRLVNGASALIAIAWCYFFFKKRKIPHDLALLLLLFLFLILSNVLAIEFLHTAKMWAYYMIFVSVTSAFFLAQEYYTRYLGKPFISKEGYAGLLVWSGVLTFFQSYFGVFTIMLITLYALLLHHISINDLWKHVRKYWYLIVLFAITQISFVYQAFTISRELGDASIKTASGSIDWAARFIMPLYYAAEGQPLTCLYLFGLVALVVLVIYKRSFFANARKQAIISIAVAHPILTYLFFYPIIGLDLLPRYGIALTLACTFSAAILMKEFGTKITKVALACAVVLFLIINVHAIDLYWHPSSETVLLSTIETTYNTPTTVFIIDHSASHLNLPVNYESLLLLDQKRQVMGRFTFLSQNSDLLKADTSFKPITITAYESQEQTAAIESYATSSNSVWLISRDCTNLCSADETAAGSCFELNTFACGIQPQEVNTLPVYLASPRLGFSYIVRRVH